MDGPTITTSASSLSEVGYSTADFSQQVKLFTVSGSSLTENVTVTAPTNYEVCKTSDGTYTSSVTFDKGSGTLSASTVYVRLKSGKTAGNYSGNISCTSGATEKTVALSGSVPFTVTWSTPDDANYATTYVAYATAPGTALGTLPSDPSTPCGGRTFYGWYDGGAYSHASDAPSIISTSTTITSDKTFIAVFATRSGSGAVTWDKVTNTPSDWSGDYVIVASSTANAMISDFHSGTSGEFKTASVTINASGTQITSTPSDKMIWTFSKNGVNAQYSLKNKSTGTYAKITGKNSINAALDASAVWFTIESASNGIWDVASVTNSARCFAYYTSNSSFRTYAKSSYDTGRLFKKSGEGYTWSDFVTTCAACSSDPVMTSATAALKGAFSLTSVGVTVTGCAVGSNCSWTDYGFVWGTSANPTVSNNKVPVGTSGSATTWDGTLTGPFTVGTTYHYRAYGKNGYASGTYQYSSDQTFTPQSVTFNLNGHGSSTPSTQYVNNGSKATDPSYSESVTGWRFDGWYANSNCTGSAWDFSTNTVSGDNVTLYAKWTQVYTVTYNYNGGTSSCADANKYAAGTSVTVCSTPPEKAGSTFQGWLGDNNIGTKAAGSTFTMPAANVTLTAQWTDTNYTLSYTGSNYTKTENKTQIKSSDTPLDLHFTCADSYGFPSTISLSGGGQSWTAGTNYTWTVDESKQSATLHINELAISADVTIGISMKTRYTVTYDYPQGVIGSTPTTSVHYFVNGEAQTLKTVTNVSCGDYDTFEGWTTSANKITVEATSATGILTGSYTATGDITLYAMYSHADAGATGYNKITGGVTAGDYVIATNKNSGTDYAYKAQTSHVETKVSDGNISSLPSGADEVTISLGTGQDAGYFAIAYDNSGTPTYIYAYDGNGLSTSTSVKYDWYLDSDPSTLGEIHSRGQTTRYLQSNNGNSGTGDFKGYAHTQAPAYLFKKGGKKYISTPSCATPTQVTVTYDANGGGVGSITCSEATLDYGTYPALDEDYTICNTFNRTGYTLYKWHTRAGGTGGTDYDPGEVVGPTHAHTGFGGETVTLYAQWRKKVSFNIGNATGSVADVVDTDNDGNITLPDATGITAIACGAAPNSYTLIGWSETPVDDTHDAPTSGFYAIGATYPCTRSTLYAVYRGDRDESTDPNLFTLSNTTGSGETYYMAEPSKAGFANIDGDGKWNGSKSQFRGVADASQAKVFGVEDVAGKSYKLLYWMNGSTKYYSYLATSETSFSAKTELEMNSVSADDKKYYGWIENTSNSSVQYQNNMYQTRYLKRGTIDGTKSPKEAPFAAYTTSDAATWFTKGNASSVRYTYSSTPSCSDVVTITFNLHGGSFMGAKDADDYVDIEKNSTVQLPNAEWTRDNEWTFVGWTTVSVSLTEDASSITPLYEAGDDFTAINTTLHAVYKYTPTPPIFDGTVSGTWKIYGIVDGTYHYAKTLDAEYSSTSYCLEATDFEFTNISTNKYYIKDLSTNKYLQGRASNKNDILHTTTPVEWTVVSNGDGTWKVSDDRYSDRYLACGKGSPWVIQNGASSQFGNNGNLVYVRFGGCSNPEYASEPTLSPSITLGSTGSLNVTSTNGKTIYAANKLTIEATRYGEQTRLYLFSDNANIGFRKGDGTALLTDGVGPYIQTDASGELATTNITITYTPNVSTDGIETATITVRDNTSPSVQASATRVIKARHLPTDFVIAAKWGDQWYALPANCTESTSSTAGVLIEVDNTNDPTCATGAPKNTKYGLLPVRPGRVSSYGNRLVFTEHLSTATTDNQKTLYNGAATSIQVYATYANYAKENPEKYEWIPTTSDLKDYTLTSATVLAGDASARTVSLNTSGVFGTLLQAKDYDGKVRLLPATFYEPAEVQILKWKTNSVIVMYTGTEDAKTQVGTNSASDPQALNSHKLTHGIYEFTTNEALTANAGQTLRITLGSSRLEVEIPLIIAGNTTAAANGKDVVILDGATFTAAATKYSYRNVYVYGGGKLDIPSGKSLGVNNIILRAGGISTDGSGRSAMYEYKYPQVKLVGTLTSTQTNIKYEYVTDYVHWYHLCLPFNALTSTIQYPQEYYGSNVAADNHGSWVIKRYDGATRATGNYDAWVDIESPGEPTPTTVTAGNGYIFWGAPKKVSVGGGAATRQAWGIQRMTMAITAGDAKDAENADKNVTDLAAHSSPAGGVNDQGWNLIGNPYMANLTGLEGTSLKTGKLIKEMVNGKWTGRWESNNDALRYITVPNNNFETYEAVAVAGSGMTLTAGKAFFVQLDGEANAVQFETSKRALAPAWYRNAEAEQPVDVETGIVMSSETLADEVNFWIKDGKTAAYEFNADYPKTPNKTNFNIYGVHQSGNLSWVAISPAIAEGDMAIGYQVPAAGDYTLSLSEKYIAEDIESVFVTDHGVSPELTTDLMVNTYTFTVHQAETNNERFTVSIKVREEDNIATDIGNNTVDTHAVKFIRDDKMYILHNGLLYDATGKRVNGINK